MPLYIFYSKETYYEDTTDATDAVEQTSKSKEREFDKRILINKTRPEPCDQIMMLYQINRDKNVFKTPSNGCERPFIVWPIQKSNLIFLVFDTLCPFTDPHMQLNTLPFEKVYNSSLACYKSLFELTRRRPTSCINQHQNVSAFFVEIFKTKIKQAYFDILKREHFKYIWKILLRSIHVDVSDVTIV